MLLTEILLLVFFITFAVVMLNWVVVKHFERTCPGYRRDKARLDELRKIKTGTLEQQKEYVALAQSWPMMSRNAPFMAIVITLFAMITNWLLGIEGLWSLLAWVAPFFTAGLCITFEGGPASLRWHEAVNIFITLSSVTLMIFLLKGSVVSFWYIIGTIAVSSYCASFLTRRLEQWL